MITVVIPVYRDVDSVIECLDSVIYAECIVDYNILIVNDCSPEEEIGTAIKKYLFDEKVYVFRNNKNEGFVRSANIGMQLFNNSDIVLLNSDAVVPNGWLDSIEMMASLHKNIATITPFSNNATICSFPVIDMPNHNLFFKDKVEEINLACRSKNEGLILDIPTAVGFCMYIRREAINDLGYFNEDLWGRGYGEENDFSIKCHQLGWRNVILCDTYVYHAGSKSFKEETGDRLISSQALLKEMYPEYLTLVGEFVDSDPLRKARTIPVIDLFNDAFNHYEVHVTHSWGGGIEKFVKSYAMAQKEISIGILILRPNKLGGVLVELYSYGNVLYYSRHVCIKDIAEDLGCFKPVKVVYHQIIGYQLEILQLPLFLEIPYDVYLHDYYLACPRINFINDSDEYCYQQSGIECNRCLKSSANSLHELLAKQYIEAGGSIDCWRDMFYQFLTDADRVLCSSKDSMVRLRRYFHIRNIEYKPFEDDQNFRVSLAKSSSSRIAILGAIGQHKGYSILCSLLSYASENNINIHFYLIGYTKDDEALQKYKCITILGKYDSSNIKEYVRDFGLDKALFLSIWPETYSYTLSEAIENELYPIALDIGAIAERVRRYKVGEVIDRSASPKEIIEACLRN